MFKEDQLVQQFVNYFQSSCLPIGERRVGMEVEYFAFQTSGPKRANYRDKPGPESILHALIAKGGSANKTYRDSLLAVDTPEGCVNLESGGQIEYSSLPASNLHALSTLWRSHLGRLLDVSENQKLRLVAGGVDMISELEDVDWIPNRGNVERYLQMMGRHHMKMGKMSASVHVSLDYGSENEAIDILLTSKMITPIISAIFSTSPYIEQRYNGYQSERDVIWKNMADLRSRKFEDLFKHNASFEEYGKNLKSLPLMWLPDGNGVSQTCSGENLAEKIAMWEASSATEDQLAACMAQVWGDVRLKSTIELRGVDSPMQKLTMCVPAMWVGLLYDAEARAQCRVLIEENMGGAPDLIETMVQNGFKSAVTGEQLLTLARDLIYLADAALKRRGILDASERDESSFLDPIKEMIERGASSSDLLIEEFGVLLRPVNHDLFLNRLRYEDHIPNVNSEIVRHKQDHDLWSSEFGGEADVERVLSEVENSNTHIVKVLDPSPGQIETLLNENFHHKPCRVSYEILLPKLKEDETAFDAYLNLLSSEGRRKIRKAYQKSSQRIETGELTVSWQSCYDSVHFDEFVSLHSVAMSTLPRGRPLLSESVANAMSNASWLGEDKYLLCLLGKKGIVAGCIVRFEGDRYSIMFAASSTEEKQASSDAQAFLTWLVVERCLSENLRVAAYGSDPNLYGHEIGLGLLRFKSVLGFIPKARPREELIRITNYEPLEFPLVFFAFGKGSQQLNATVLTSGSDFPKVAGLGRLVSKVNLVKVEN